MQSVHRYLWSSLPMDQQLRRWWQPQDLLHLCLHLINILGLDCLPPGQLSHRESPCGPGEVPQVLCCRRCQNRDLPRTPCGHCFLQAYDRRCRLHRGHASCLHLLLPIANAIVLRPNTQSHLWQNNCWAIWITKSRESAGGWHDKQPQNEKLKPKRRSIYWDENIIIYIIT